MTRYLKEISARLNCGATAADFWLMLICLIHVLGREIPWYVWVIFVIELLVVMREVSKLKEDEA